MLRADRMLKPGSPARDVEVAWLGGCHAPPTRQFFACYPLLTELCRHLEPRVLDTPVSRFPGGIFGAGERFRFEVPDDVLERSPRVTTDPVHFAASYVFFAACAGELVPRPDLTDRVPLGCVSRETGEELGEGDVVIGFSTLFSFEAASNENPVIEALRFGDADAPDAECASDADCAASGEAAACSSAGRCAAVVAPCPADCPKRWIGPSIAPASAEPLPGEDHAEVVWANFYANGGELNTFSQLVNDRTSGWVEDYSAEWTPPATPGEVTIWVTVNDQRGGAAWRSVEVIVR
jgi:hypothetical protein